MFLDSLKYIRAQHLDLSAKGISEFDRTEFLLHLVIGSLELELKGMLEKDKLYECDRFFIISRQYNF